MIVLEAHAEGTIVPVKASPGSRRNAILGLHDGRLKIAVMAPPEKGKANLALAALLAQTCQIRRGDVELVTGDTAAEKRFLVRGLTPTQVRLALAKWVSSAEAS